jgi:hypothetical protein
VPRFGLLVGGDSPPRPGLNPRTVMEKLVLLLVSLRGGLFVCFLGRPGQATDALIIHYFLLYRTLWTFQLWPVDVSAPTDASRTLAAEGGTYGRGIGPVI